MENIRRWIQRVDLFLWVFGILGSLLLAFVFLPILATLLGTGLPAVLDVLRDPEALSSLWVTFYAALWATLLAFVSGVPLAYLLARYNFRGKAWMRWKKARV